VEFQISLVTPHTSFLSVPLLIDDRRLFHEIDFQQPPAIGNSSEHDIPQPRWGHELKNSMLKHPLLWDFDKHGTHTTLIDRCQQICFTDVQVLTSSLCHRQRCRHGSLNVVVLCLLAVNVTSVAKLQTWLMLDLRSMNENIAVVRILDHCRWRSFLGRKI